jgi:hypothetical protein
MFKTAQQYSFVYDWGNTFFGYYFSFNHLFHGIYLLIFLQLNTPYFSKASLTNYIMIMKMMFTKISIIVIFLLFVDNVRNIYTKGFFYLIIFITFEQRGTGPIRFLFRIVATIIHIYALLAAIIDTHFPILKLVLPWMVLWSYIFRFVFDWLYPALAFRFY